MSERLCAEPHCFRPATHAIVWTWKSSGPVRSALVCELHAIEWPQVYPNLAFLAESLSDP